MSELYKGDLPSIQSLRVSQREVCAYVCLCVCVCVCMCVCMCVYVCVWWLCVV